ncbi:MAG: pro-sigmaK processing inhibitor BofA family protein [Clostridia bacterium]|nr:pro-sigmaK processing inhibitor BofA family protein [Clostridia bacterium]
MIHTVKIALLMAMVFCVLWLLVSLVKGKSPKKVLVWSALSGVISLFVISLLGEKFSQTLSINAYTLGTASVLGVPGVILMVATKILWQL